MQKDLSNKRCSCFKAKLKCTELCQCSNSEYSEIDEELIDNVNDFDEEAVDCDDGEFV
jgi:hypothetical protein